MIEEANLAMVHHIVVYFCHGNLVPDTHGRVCWEGRMPENSTDCDTLAYGWAVGQGVRYRERSGMGRGVEEKGSRGKGEVKGGNWERRRWAGRKAGKGVGTLHYLP